MNQKTYHFSDTELDCMYINEGKEGTVYRRGDYALKIYHSLSDKIRLNEATAKRLSTIHTRRFTLPLGHIYDQDDCFVGYYMNLIINNPLDFIQKMRMKYFIEEVEELEKDSDTLGEEHISIHDLTCHNVLYDGCIHVIDPGSYLYEKDCSRELLRRVNRYQLNEFLMYDLLGRGYSLKIRRNIADYYKKRYIGDFSDFLKEDSDPNETVKQYVSRIS